MRCSNCGKPVYWQRSRPTRRHKWEYHLEHGGPQDYDEHAVTQCGVVAYYEQAVPKSDELPYTVTYSKAMATCEGLCKLNANINKRW